MGTVQASHVCSAKIKPQKTFSILHHWKVFALGYSPILVGWGFHCAPYLRYSLLTTLTYKHMCLLTIGDIVYNLLVNKILQIYGRVGMEMIQVEPKFPACTVFFCFCFFNIAMHSTYWVSLSHTLLLVSKPDPFCFLPLIAFSIRKQSALRNRKGLACEIELLQMPFVHYFSTLHQPPLHLPSPSHTLLQEQWVTRSSLNAETLKMLTYTPLAGL